jgi:4-hydroxy-3-methylbut-2-enyl diphosphate reductase
VTQTTLSIDETAEIIAALQKRFPTMIGPQKEDIRYATTNRQRAVKEMLPQIEVLFVIGSRNSSNSTRLVETARTAEVAAYMIEDESEIDETWLEGRETAGLTSRASAPEKLLLGVCDWFRARGVTEIAPLASRSEDVSFKLPVELGRVAAHTAV